MSKLNPPEKKPKSYGFRSKLELPLSGGDIREIIENGGVVFSLLAKGNMEALQTYLMFYPHLNGLLAIWAEWGQEKYDIKMKGGI